MVKKKYEMPEIEITRFGMNTNIMNGPVSRFSTK